jgi:hypothetical protein
MRGQGPSRGSQRRPPRSVLLLFVLLTVLAGTPARADQPCEDSDIAVVFSSPRTPEPGKRLRAIAVSERRFAATLEVLDPNGDPVGETTERRGGPPYWWYVDVMPQDAGGYRAILQHGLKQVACRAIDVGTSGDDAHDRAKGMWPVTHDWSLATEDLYSAWIEHLFDDPLDVEPAWRALHEVTRDPERNFLHDHLGLREDDEHGLRLEPDCADLPYFLRAYFAWKLGLPFGYSECTRGEGGKPPRCSHWRSNLDASLGGGATLERIQLFFGDVAAAAQSGAGRTGGDDDQTDFYPTRLARDTLRPGTVYADPYGHMLVVVRRLPQTASDGGLLLAVDAQPDGTVARKRYWRGNFLFVHDPTLGSPGFKHFRPVVISDEGGLRLLTNDEIGRDQDYGDFDLEQDKLKTEAFYDRVDAVLSPRPQDPTRALQATLDALEEQVHARVRSIANGEDYVAKHPDVIAMPDGAAIFETSGPWEDFATPARDLRLLIAIDVARAFPEKVTSRPERFTLPAGYSPDDVGTELKGLLERDLASRHLDYTRSDGSTWRLSLADVVERAPNLEMAYNPNDCVEMRWGAPPRSKESETCRRHAPDEQTERMRRYREWFSARRRPPR